MSLAPLDLLTLDVISVSAPSRMQALRRWVWVAFILESGVPSPDGTELTEAWAAVESSARGQDPGQLSWDPLGAVPPAGFCDGVSDHNSPEKEEEEEGE